MMMAAAKGAAKDKQTSEKHDDLAKADIKVSTLSLLGVNMANPQGKHLDMGQALLGGTLLKLGRQKRKLVYILLLCNHLNKR